MYHDQIHYYESVFPNVISEMTVKKTLNFTDNLIVDSHSDFQGYVKIPNQLNIKLILLLKCIF